MKALVSWAADLGPCTRCRKTTIRYGEHGQTLCETCLYTQERAHEHTDV